MKRIISMLLTAAVLMSLLAGLSMTAFADTLVDEVELTMDVVTAGAALPTTVTTGEYGTVAGISWEKWNFTASAWEAVSGNAEAGNAYRMTARVNANAGYEFDTACHYYINGVKDNYAYGDGTYVDVIHAFPVGLTEINQVTFATEPTVTEGVDRTQALAGLTVAADAPYVITDAQWYEMDLRDNTYGSFSGTFQKGKVYTLETYLAPKAGFWFDQHFEASAANLDNYNASEDEARVWVNLCYYLTTPIAQVDITVTGVEMGKNAADVKVTVPEGANYTVEEFFIYDYDWDNFSGTFAKDGYRVEAYLEAAEGYHFPETVKVTINGKPVEDVYGGDIYCWVDTEFDFRTPVDKADITVTGVEMGKNAADVKVTVPEGVNYTVEEFYILDNDWNIFSGTFAKEAYYVGISLEAADECYFTDDAVFTINGQAPDYESFGGDEAYLEVYYDLRDQIKQVELPAWPEVKAGEPVPEIQPVDPEGKPYSYTVGLFDYATGDPASGTFADNTVYAATYLVEADEGYGFAEDVIITVGGVVHTGMVENLGDGMIIVKLYALGNAKLIDRLDVTVEMPAIGAKPGKVSVDENAGYGLAISEWVVSTRGRFDDVDLAGEVFKLGEHVYLILGFAVESGALDPNVKVFINGKEYALVPEITNINGRSFLTAVYLGQLLNKVDTFKLSGAHPSAGRTPGEAKDAGSEHCKLESAVWGVSKEQGKDIQALSGTYAAGDHAYLTVTYAFDDTYTAAEDLKILFNGKEYPLVEGLTSVADGKLTATIYIGQMKAATNPGTGDTTPVVMLAVLAVASVLGMGVLIGRRKAC